MKNILVIGSSGCGKSTTINALLGKKAATCNEISSVSGNLISKYESNNETFWDVSGFGNGAESDLMLGKSIISLIRKETADGKRLINIILLVIDASSRDMGTEYRVVSNILMPNVDEKQNIIIGLNQCDFCMKGKNWNKEKNEPNEILGKFLKQRVMSVKERLKDSTGLDTEPVYYSALYGYNVDVLHKIIISEKDANMSVLDDKERWTSIKEKEDLDRSRDDVLVINEGENYIARKVNDTLSSQSTISIEQVDESGDKSNDDMVAAHNIDDVCNLIKNGLEEADIDDGDRKLIIEHLSEIKNQELNIMLVGGTGAGKSSTINALFGENVAVVGEGVNPQTDKIEKYSLSKVTLWDTPGLGDSPQNDEIYSKQIVAMLNKDGASGNRLIDVVLVVIDASAQELGTSYHLINDVIIPNIGDKRRVLIALNQCDFAMKGKYWDRNTNTPKPRLEDFLREKSISVSNRIRESTGVEVNPVYYSALYKYNIAKLFFYLLDSTPDEKRLNLIPQMNKDVRVWDNNDDNIDYKRSINKAAIESYQDTFARVLKDIPKDFVSTVFNVIGHFVYNFVDAMWKTKK